MIPDVAVVGAGVFGTWTAWSLAGRGLKVVLVDAYGAANGRASSGGESRIIRLGYGRDELYTRWSARSLPAWEQLSQTVQPPLFHRTGVLWLAAAGDPLCLSTLATLRALGMPHEILERAELQGRHPHMDFEPGCWGILEPGSGVIMARRAVQALLERAVAAGVTFLRDRVEPDGSVAGAEGGPRSRLRSVPTSAGAIQAGTFVFACGAWLPRLFPALLAGRIEPTRQEVFFFGPPAGDRRYAPPGLPAWIDFGQEVYGLPDLEGRGVKIALDHHGPRFDPDTGDRGVGAASVQAMRARLAARLPGLARAPLIETRVCQYENTSSGDFLIDRHPALENVWLVGGGSGHGFKHGPAVGEYVAERIAEGGPADERFRLAAKGTLPARRVY